MRDFAFAEARPQLVPAHKRSTLVIAVVLHALAIAVLIQVKSQPERVVSEGAPQGSITVYLPAPPAAAPAAAAKPPEAKMALKTEPVKEEVQPDTTAGSAGVIGAEPTPSGPVRLGSGGSVTLLRKVQPVYPPMMRSARITGQVVLDAIIHADGTIGDVTVLQSSNPAFTRSAVDAVKQWRYQPIGYEAILTVSVSFTLT